MAEGWIKLHRKVLESGFWMESQAVHLWIHLLIEASHKPRRTYFNGQIIELKEGQLITGRRKLSQETGIGEQVVRKWLNIFEFNQQITIQKTAAGSCISILNYSTYQENNPHSNQRPTNDQPTVNQPPTNDQPLYKELKNGNNDKNVRRRGVVFTPPTRDQVRTYFLEIGVNGQEFEKFHDYYQAKGWVVGRSKMKDWEAACRNWKKNMIQFKEKNNGKGGKSASSEMDKLRDWYDSVNATGQSEQCQ